MNCGYTQGLHINLGPIAESKERMYTQGRGVGRMDRWDEDIQR